jgi:hypothetical protein
MLGALILNRLAPKWVTSVQNLNGQPVSEPSIFGRIKIDTLGHRLDRIELE